MNQELLERVLRCPTLPTLPAVAVHVIELTHRANVSIEELARTIQNDQALSAKILKTVNSSFYGLRRPCGTINQALVMLGLATVKSLALGFSLISSVGTSGEGGFDYVSYWRRGLFTAVAAKCIAREAGVEQEDEAFLGGLLQDVGMVALHQALGDEYLAVLEAAGPEHRRLAKAELEALELQHPDVGAMLAQRWKLPAELIMPVKYHEVPTAAPQPYAPLVRCVALGNVAHDVLTDAEPLAALRRFHRRAADWFGLDAATCDGLISTIADGAREVAPLFRLNTGSLPDAESILEQAKAQMETLAAQPAAETGHAAVMSELLSDGQQNDPLTGVLARAALGEQAEVAFATATANRRPLSVITLALDGFDAALQKLGVEAGDAALAEAAALCESRLAPRGVVIGRTGEATFTLIAPGLDRAGAVRAAGELRAAFLSESPGWRIAGLPNGVTVSVGVAAAEPAPVPVFSRVQQLLLASQRAAEAAAIGGGNGVRAFVPKQAA